MHLGRLCAMPMILLALVSGCSESESPEAAEQVVVYTSVDEVFARPIAERFTKDTGIDVKLVPDTEETKSTGLLNRLIAEETRPVADVFWSGDPVRAAILKDKGVSAAYRSPRAEGLPQRYSDPDGHWTGFSARARVLMYNTDKVPDNRVLRSVMALLDPQFKGEVAIANPLFGTTTMHAAALFQGLGHNKAKQFFMDFIANGGVILSSNGEVRRRVSAGEFAVGLTDTDDFNVARVEGQSVSAVYPDQQGMGTLIIPNCAVLIKGAPHVKTAKQFIDYLLRPETEQLLAESEAAQMPVRASISVPEHVRELKSLKPMNVDYTRLADTMERISTGFLNDWVNRNL